MSQGNHNNYFVHTLLRARDWQHRPEFDQVCDWWRAGGKGVCGLVGMGGAGKTAIADRFLQVLPGVMPEDRKAPKDLSLPKPNGIFVFSFYDAPNPEAFFEALYMWLAGSPSVDGVSFNQLLFMVRNAVPGLMFLDGLEKVQEDGAKGIFGRLNSPNLRDFINRLAGGYLPGLSVLITTRFRLADLGEAKSQFFKSIPIEEIDIPMGIQLLRGRGVRGTDLQLEQIVKDCGQHALTVDFAGGYIKEYGDGEPQTPLDLGTAEELREAADKEQDDDRREVLKQGFRFARVAQRYREAMLEKDEAAIALLERICLFRLGVASDTLAAIFTGAKATKVSGKALAGLDANQLQKKLDWLVRMRLLEGTDTTRAGHPSLGSGAREIPRSAKHDKRIIYNIHPAVRDGFLSGIGREVATASHEAVRQGLEVSLGSAPEDNPSDHATLDLLEEIVHHTLAANHVAEAFSLYWHRLGNYYNLGWCLGAYGRGERVCRAFISRLGEYTTLEPLAELSYRENQNLLVDWASYLSELGRTDEAIRCYERVIQQAVTEDDISYIALGNYCLADALILRGFLKDGLQASVRAVEASLKANDPFIIYRSYGYASCANTLIGKVKTALANFESTLRWQRVDEGTPERQLWSFFGLYYGRLLMHLGKVYEAVSITKRNQQTSRDERGANDTVAPQCNVLLAELARQRGDLPEARERCGEAHQWALERDAQVVLCWSSLVAAKIELSAFSGQQSAEKEKHLLLEHSKSALEDGLRIARNCGYGIYHINLILARAAVALHEGRADDTLRDLDIACDDSIQSLPESGQPELLAANDKECGYTWGIAEGLHVRGEALLLKAAQTLGTDSFVPAKRDRIPSDVRALVGEAENCLTEALKYWHELCDPEPDNANFIHPESGDEYNHRAAETFQVLKDLTGGILTTYPVEEVVSSAAASLSGGSKASLDAPTVFISYNHGDGEIADKLKATLEKSGIVVRIDKAVMEAGANIQEFIESSIRDTGVTLSIISNRSLLSAWVALESIDTFYHERFTSSKKFIACYVDDDFFRTDFRLNATKQIDLKIGEIDELIPEYMVQKIDTNDLNSQKSRLYKLRNNLGDILLRLKESLCVDIRKDKFDESVAKIVSAIKGKS
jgi:tetratricopeptide (TPR) repeat protein